MFLDVWNTATNLSNSYSNDMLTVKLSGFPDMHWRDFFTSTRRQVAHYYLVFKHSLHVIRRNLKIPIARVSRFVDWCAVMTLESISCLFCQSKEFDRVTDWLSTVYKHLWCMSSIFLCSKMIIRLGHSVICSIDYWLLYVNRYHK